MKATYNFYKISWTKHGEFYSTTCNQLNISLTFLRSKYFSQEKILHTRRPKLSFSRATRRTVWKLASCCFCCLRVKWKIKNITMVNFQQQNTQRLINGYGHMNSRNDRWMMRLKAIEDKYYSIENQKSYSS